VAVVAVLVASGAAQGFITIFQPTQLAPIAVSAADVRSLQELASYGDVSGLPTLAITPVTRAQAESLSGIAPPSPGSLPAGITGEATFDVVGSATVSFTFDQAKAEAAARAAGATLPHMPANVDGSTLQLSISPTLVESYGVDPARLVTGGGSGPAGPALVILAARLPVVTSTGATAAQIEAYLLDQPSIPPDLAAEIRAMGDPATTLPVPIPVDLASAQPVTVDGASGLVIGDQSGAGSLVVWERTGVIYAVLGSMSSSTVLGVADSIH
jgi:hypothetical protein